MNVTIEVKGVKMTIEEARSVYNELHKLFGAQSAKQPSIFDKIQGPYYPDKTYPPYNPNRGTFERDYTASVPLKSTLASSGE